MCRPVILGASRRRRPGAAVTASRPAGQHTVRRHNRASCCAPSRRTSRCRAPGSRQRTGLTRGTVSSLVEELLAAGLVAELAAARGATGRPASPLQLNRSGPGGLGVEIGVDAVGGVRGRPDRRGPRAADRRVRPPAPPVAGGAPGGGRAGGGGGRAGRAADRGGRLAVPGVVADGVLERAPNLRCGATSTSSPGPPRCSRRSSATYPCPSATRPTSPRWPSTGQATAGDDFLYVSGGIGVGAGIVLGGRLFGGSGGLLHGGEEGRA